MATPRRHIIRTGRGKIGLLGARRLFRELAGDTLGGGKTAVAWNAFRIGIQIAQQGKVPANDVKFLRLHMQELSKPTADGNQPS